MRFVRASLALASLLAAVVASAPDAHACTTFETRGPAGTLVAKNFDWPTGAGYMVLGERGRVHTKLVPGGPSDVASWTSRFASVSFTTVGPGFPISGMNEAGLTIEALVDASVHPTVTPDAARLTGLELVEYGLDRFESVADFADFAEGHGFSQLAVPLHLFACDRGGACAVVESAGASTRVTRGSDLDVKALANDPYRADVSAGAGARGSAARFATVAHGVQGGRARDVAGAFRLLDEARIPGLTKWQIVWDIELATVHFRDRPGAPIAAVHVDWSGVTCAGAQRVRAIGGASASSPLFAPWSPENATDAGERVLDQLHARSALAQHLASAVAASTRETRCE